MIEITKDPNTLLLLHGKDLTDSSPYAHAITNNGVTVSIAQSKFGGSSLYFNGSSSSLTIKSDLFNFGSGDFTVDWWEYVTTAPSTRFTLSYNGSGWGGICAGGNTNTNSLYVSSNSAWDIVSNKAFDTTQNTWVHWAVVRHNGTFYTFKNGQLYFSKATSGAIWWNGAGLIVGAFPMSSHYFGGYMDEFRVSNVARWTAAFTPPTEPYEGGGMVITEGGVIPKKYALRRRILATEIKPAQQNAAIQLLGTFYYSSTSYSEVVIDGVTYNAPQTITVPKGTVITLRVRLNAWYNKTEWDSKITINGTTVAIATASGQTLTYNHTANEDMVVESVPIYEAWGNMSFELRVTT